MNETANAIALHVSQMKMQYRASAFDKKKIEHQMISLITSSKVVHQNDDFIVKEIAILSLFSTSSKWITSVQSAGNS